MTAKSLVLLVCAMTLSGLAVPGWASPAEGRAVQASCGDLLKEDFSSIADAPTHVFESTLTAASADIPGYCPIFPYPVTARYRGHGDSNDASNFIPAQHSGASGVN